MPYPISLGGNVFGWTADERESFAVLDAYYQAGGNLLDTSDAYGAGGPGSEGGHSESIIGRWMKSRGNRDELIVATKVGARDRMMSLSPPVIRRSIDASLKRLQTDRVDVYYAHLDDPYVPQAEMLATFAELVDRGLVGQLGSCNYRASRLRRAVELIDRHGLPPWAFVSYRYNLLERSRYEDELREICAGAGIACVPYWGLARGFLTGKYRPGGPVVDSVRARHAAAYLERDVAMPLLHALDEIAAEREVPVGAVALAWLRHQPTIASPVASARNVAQLDVIRAAAELELTASELERLDALTSPRPKETVPNA
jgi:aryl-alcohol dehydrogenase-like predicted oxidoreductase